MNIWNWVEVICWIVFSSIILYLFIRSFIVSYKKRQKFLLKEGYSQYLKTLEETGILSVAIYLSYGMLVLGGVLIGGGIYFLFVSDFEGFLENVIRGIVTISIISGLLFFIKRILKDKINLIGKGKILKYIIGGCVLGIVIFTVYYTYLS
mgnify:CR=1 FL=1